MAIIRSGRVLPPRTVMELQLLTSQLSPVAISWLSAQPMLVVEHLTSWWHVPDLVRVAVVAPIGNADNSSLSEVISMAQAVLNLCVRRKVSLKHQLNWIQSVVQYRICPCVTFGLLTILLRFWMNICPCWLDVMYQPRSSVCETRISVGLMINAGKQLASRKLIFSGPVIALGLTGKSSQSYPFCLQVERGQASLVRLEPLWWYWPIGHVSSFP